MSLSLRNIAIHEAGHAVVGRVLGLVCGGATIVPDYEARAAGDAIITGPLVSASACDEVAWESAV